LKKMSANPNPMGALQGGDLVGELKNWFHNCPPFTKGLLYICSTIALLNSITGISAILINIPYAVVHGFQIHRLVFSPFTFGGILEALFGFFAYLSVSTRLEKEWGTIKTAVDFLWKNFFINILWIAIAYVVSIITNKLLGAPCYGLWQPFFAFIVQTCLANPDGVSMLLCLPIQIKTKYYPAALWVLLSIMSGGPRFDNLVAILVGYLHYKYLNSAYHSFLDSSRMAAWAGTIFFSWFQRLPNYINAAGVSSGNNQSSSSTSTTTTANPTNVQPQAFRGQGVSIGGAPEEPVRTTQKQSNEYFQLDESEDLENNAGNNHQ